MTSPPQPRLSRRSLLRALGAGIAACVLGQGPSTLARPAGADDFETAVIYLRSMPASRARVLYDRLLGAVPGSSLVEGREGRSVIVKDTRARLARFRGVLEALDVPTKVAVRIYARPVQHRSASELADLVVSTVDVPRDVPLVVVPDDRSAVLVVRTTREVYGRVDRLLRRLDVAGRPSAPRRDVRILPKPDGDVFP